MGAKAALIAGVAACCAVAVLPGIGPEISAQQAPQFRSKLELIQIDVTVVDVSTRLPVRGLTAEDFTLYEDGEERDIRGFAEIYIPGASDGPSWMNDTAPDVRTASDGRVLVFLLDDAQMDGMVTLGAKITPEVWLETVRRVTTEVIEQMGPTDVAAVICTFDDKCAQDFTNDRELLKAALARFSPKKQQTTGGRGSWQYDFYRQTAGVTGSVVKQLIEQPGRRKAMIYVSPRPMTRPAVWPPRIGNMSRAVTQNAVVDAFEEALRAKVTVYTINTTGLAAMVEPRLAVPPPPEPPPGSNRAPRFRAEPGSLSYETGGFNVTSPEYFKRGVAQIFRETGSYYLLGFEKVERRASLGYNETKGYRVIDVRVNKPGAEVRSRTGYVEPREVKPPSKPVAPAEAALAGILPKSDLPLRVTAVAIAEPGQPEATVNFALGVSEPAPRTREIDRLEIQARAFTQRGDPRGAWTFSAAASLAPSSDDSTVELLGSMRLKPGVYALRFGVNSTRMDTAGSVYADVVVPDFTKAPLSMSTIVVHTVPRQPALMLNPLSPSLPSPLSIHRTFKDGDATSTITRIYQGGVAPIRPVKLTIRIVDEQNRVALETYDTVDASKFDSNRTADYRYALPIASLPAAYYVLRLEAAAGDDRMRNDIRFTVTR